MMFWNLKIIGVKRNRFLKIEKILVPVSNFWLLCEVAELIFYYEVTICSIIC